jgi:hypothetical protein
MVRPGINIIIKVGMELTKLLIMTGGANLSYRITHIVDRIKGTIAALHHVVKTIFIEVVMMISTICIYEEEVWIE